MIIAIAIYFAGLVLSLLFIGYQSGKNHLQARADDVIGAILWPALIVLILPLAACFLVVRAGEKLGGGGS